MTQRRGWMQTEVPFKPKRRPRCRIEDSWLFKTGAFDGDRDAIRKHLQKLKNPSKR